jgi:hypothetical protein
MLGDSGYLLASNPVSHQCLLASKVVCVVEGGG